MPENDKKALRVAGHELLDRIDHDIDRLEKLTAQEPTRSYGES